MIQNVFPTDELSAHARAAAKSYSQKSVHPKLVDDALLDGWDVIKAGKSSVRLKREKAHGLHLEDRVWTLLYRMGYTAMSGKRGAVLDSTVEEGTKVTNQIAVFAIDDDVTFAIECKSSSRFARSPQFQEELAKFSALRDQIVRKAKTQWPISHKRHTVFAFFLNNIHLSDADRERASQANVLIFDESDLAYYEKLVSHIGPAAKYQMYADMLPGKTIAGLSIRVPAVRAKMGAYNCYTFPVSPEYLLKIAYVSHRSKGKASDIHTYQRMIVKSRLNKIREYISDQGVFPTNIVVNVEKRSLAFHRVKQETDDAGKESGGVLGWLELKPAYKSAWVIDGQHRLFSYSGHPFARTGHLAVLAFEGLPPSSQAKLFIDINAKQKSVKPSLLQELFAELHWDAESPSIRVQAIVSKAVQVLGRDKDSPFFGRIQTADSVKDTVRCISLTTLFKAINSDLFVLKELKGEVVDSGVLWQGDSEATLVRTVRIVKHWFSAISEGAREWWDLGSKDGGGFAMNDSVTACMIVLRSVIQHLESGGRRLAQLDDEDLAELLTPYAMVLASYFGRMGEEDRKRYRELRGSQGQTARARRMQQALKARFSAFDPPGLDEFLTREKEQTNLRAKTIIDRLERLLQSVVIQELKEEYSQDAESWWIQGVPKSIRLEVMSRKERDDSKRGTREAYFDLIDYRQIAEAQWGIFQNVLGYGKKTESKVKQTKWLQDINEMRNVVAHASSGVTLSVEQVSALEGYESWLNQKARAIDVDSDSGTEGQSDETGIEE